MHIAVSSWSFRGPLSNGSLQLAQIPQIIYELGFRHVELNDRFLTAPPPGPLARLRGAAPDQTPAPDYGRKSLMRLQQNRLRSGARLVCWTVDTDLTLNSPDGRSAQRAYLGTAIEAARFLGAPILRLTLGGDKDDSGGVGRAIDLLRGALPVAIASGVRLAVENHGGLSSAAGSLEEIVAAFRVGDNPRRWPLGVCLDLGHFEPGEHVAGLARLAPLAIHVHAPAPAFDAHRAETSIDYGLSLGALRAAGYDAAISIEYGGDGEPRQGIIQTRELIERHWPD